MPVYEYICKKCGSEFALLQRMGASEKDTVCPRCGSKEVKKKLSLFSCSSDASSLTTPSGGFGGG